MTHRLWQQEYAWGETFMPYNLNNRPEEQRNKQENFKCMEKDQSLPTYKSQIKTYLHFAYTLTLWINSVT